jgi:hypothetical protein
LQHEAFAEPLRPVLDRVQDDNAGEARAPALGDVLVSELPERRHPGDRATEQLGEGVRAVIALPSTDAGKVVELAEVVARVGRDDVGAQHAHPGRRHVRPVDVRRHVRGDLEHRHQLLGGKRRGEVAQ